MAEELEKIEDGVDNLSQLLSQWTYNPDDYSTKEDERNFVIPRILVQNGRALAQMRNRPEGLYRDISRAPFLRKSGVIGSDGKLPDIEISSLVWYGTMQQAKIAPTLENLDIRLYIREPNITKVPNLSTPEDKPYADEYIWREVPAGFHLYNNEITYGYEWLVLQDDYSTEDGIYNLRMNIEDGLGLCKFSGSQSPISLKGVEYKLLIVRRNLWDREFSLEESMPLASGLEGNSDTLAPTVNAVKNYYKKAVETAKVVTEYLEVGNSTSTWFKIENGNIVIDSPVQLKNIENLYNYLVELTTKCDSHSSTLVDNPAIDYLEGNKIQPHGISNNGFKGNIRASSLDGAKLSNGKQGLTQDVNEKSYIPFVDEYDSMGIGINLTWYARSSGKDPDPVLETELKYDTKGTLTRLETVRIEEAKSFIQSLVIGSTRLNYEIKEKEDYTVLDFTSGNYLKGPVKIKASALAIDKLSVQGTELSFSDITNVTGSSTIAYKEVFSELLGIQLKDPVLNARVNLTDLNPNISKDADGNSVGTLDTTDLESTLKALTTPTEVDEKAFQKLGSALQALYELPLSTFVYKRGKEEYKTQLGILVERVNQIRDKITQIRGTGTSDAYGKPDSENFLVHKRNSLVKSDNTKVLDSAKGWDGRDLVEELNSYTYSDEEIKSIVKYLDLVTSKKELAQELRNTVGILLVAAKETQTRLLDLETSVYGIDTKTLPGQTDPQAFLDRFIDKNLQNTINASPLFLGLNRIVRALSLEVFNTSDLEKIESEIESRVTDSDLGSKVSIKSRLDQIDEITNIIFAQISALVRLTSNGQVTYEVIAKPDGSAYTREDFTSKLNSESDFLSVIEEDHTRTQYRDIKGNWKNLPYSTELEEKAKLNFMDIYPEAHLHSPKASECGIVSQSVTETIDHEDISEWTNPDSGLHQQNAIKTNRTWDLIVVNKEVSDPTDEFAADGDYKPKIKETAVAWDNSKLERLNKKVSEITESLYSTDEVVAKYPNRVETIRRNLTNLVDDLYPNRTFSVEESFHPKKNGSEVVNETFYGPFRSSKDSTLETTKKATTNSDEYPTFKYHTSILNWIDKELFNFKLKNNYRIPGLKVDTTFSLPNIPNEETRKTTLDSLVKPKNYEGNKQISFEKTDAAGHQGIFNFSTKNLVTDLVSPMEDLGTYLNAVSKLDIIENVLGLENCYFGNLYTGKIEEVLESTTSLTDLAQKLPQDYVGELKFRVMNLSSESYDFKYLSSKKSSIQAQELYVSQNLAKASNVNYVLSRKEKPLQSRITTLESFADSLSKYFSLVEDYSKADASSFNNVRFEAAELEESLRRVVLSSERKAELHRILDLDLSEDADTDETSDTTTGMKPTKLHNNKVFQILSISDNIKKSEFTIANGQTGYTIKGTIRESYRLLPYQDSAYIKFITGSNTPTRGTSWTIKVSYVSASPTTKVKNTIYLKSKTVKSGEDLKFFRETQDALGSSPGKLLGADGWENQTEFNIYKTMNNLFTQLLNKPSGKPSETNGPLYYHLMLLAHPVKSYYISEDSTDPGNLFGGIWKRVEGRFILGVGSNGESTYGKVDKGGTENVKIEVKNLPSHNHTIPQKNLYGNCYVPTDKQDDWNYSGNNAMHGDTGGDTGNITGSCHILTPQDWRTESTGGGESFKVMPPYRTAYIWYRDSK